MENLEICKQCKGECCKAMGCQYSPEDFEDLSFEGLKKEIDKGYISIDWWEGNPFNDDRDISSANFLRVKNINSPVCDPSWGGQCSLLTENGCSLSYNDRPKGGRELIPCADKRCTEGYGKMECAKDWYEHRDTLEKLLDHYGYESKVDMEDLFSIMKNFLMQ